MLTRRGFMKTLAALGSIVLMPLDKLDRWGSILVGASPSPKGELYAGFLLLPEDAPVPAWVRQPRLGIPADGNGSNPASGTRQLNAIAELARQVPFPVYTLKTLPDGSRPGGASLIGDVSGELAGASVDFQSYNKDWDIWETTISVWALTDFPRPYPLWSSGPVESNGPAVVLEKVDFLPSPGIMVATQAGYVFYWIEKGILYTLILEPGPTLKRQVTLGESKAIVASLAVVQ